MTRRRVLIFLFFMTLASVLVVRTIRAEDNGGEGTEPGEQQQAEPSDNPAPLTIAQPVQIAPTNTSTTITPQQTQTPVVVIPDVNVSAVIDDNKNGIVDSYEALIR